MSQFDNEIGHVNKPLICIIEQVSWNKSSLLLKIIF
jgi:hypothetical protein